MNNMLWAVRRFTKELTFMYFLNHLELGNGKSRLRSGQLSGPPTPASTRSTLLLSTSYIGISNETFSTKKALLL